MIIGQPTTGKDNKQAFGATLHSAENARERFRRSGNEPKKAEKLYNKAGEWETKSKQAVIKGDYNKAGEYRIKALRLVAQAKEIERQGEI